MVESVEYYRRHLPQWQPQGTTFFVTFRLKGSLPDDALIRLREQLEQAKGKLAGVPGPQQDEPEQARHPAGWESILDKAQSGPRWLARPDIAPIIKDALLSRDGRVYTLDAFCVMPNHVHALFELLQQDDDDTAQRNKIMRSLQRQTARRANNVMWRQGVFWEDESYNEIIRSADQLLRAVRYVLDDPVRAGLAAEWQDWPWSYCREGLR